MKSRFLLCLLALLFWRVGYAQQDTLQLYHDLEVRSQQHRFSNVFFKQVFRGQDTLDLPLPIQKLTRQDFEKYRGRPIRNIRIAVENPFGFDITDTLAHATDDLELLGNSLHTRTQTRAIRNFLLFGEGDALDPYRITETVRILRSSGIFRNAIIVPENDTGDSLDLYVRVVDKWSITGKFVGTSSYRSLRLQERNFLGMDHDFVNTVQARPLFEPKGYTGSYEVNRIGHTFVNAKVIYGEDMFDTRRSVLQLERPFFSPLSRWAGGLTVGQYRIIDKWYQPDTILTNKGIVYNLVDAWASRSFLLSRKNKNGIPRMPMTNGILSLRNQNFRYLQHGAYRDSFHLYRDQSWVLGMVALSVIDYEQQQYVTRYGDPEYVGVGRFIGVTGGYDPWTESTYVGLRAGVATLGRSGYLSFIVETGQTISKIIASSTIIKGTATWYSPLIDLGSWKIRQYVRPQVMLGTDVPVNQRIVFKDDNGIGDYKSGPENGSCYSNIYLQTQAFAPWEILGFRFGPILFYSGTQVSSNSENLFSSQYYSSFGLGMLMKNERLVISTFQVSISFFPYLPGNKEGYRFNGFKAWEFGLNSLVQDKAEMVGY